MSKLFKRRKVIINPIFQYRMIGLFLLLSLVMGVSMLLFTWNEYSSFRQKVTTNERNLSLYTELVNEYINPNTNVYYVTPQEEKLIFLRLVIFIIILSMIVVLAGIIFSLRIAGPLYRLNSYLVGTANNENMPPLKFRNRDEFQFLADSYNMCVSSLKSKNKVYEEGLEEFESHIKELVDTLDSSKKVKFLSEFNKFKTLICGNNE